MDSDEDVVVSAQGVTASPGGKSLASFLMTSVQVLLITLAKIIE